MHRRPRARPHRGSRRRGAERGVGRPERRDRPATRAIVAASTTNARACDRGARREGRPAECGTRGQQREQSVGQGAVRAPAGRNGRAEQSARTTATTTEMQPLPPKPRRRSGPARSSENTPTPTTWPTAALGARTRTGRRADRERDRNRRHGRIATDAPSQIGQRSRVRSGDHPGAFMLIAPVHACANHAVGPTSAIIAATPARPSPAPPITTPTMCAARRHASRSDGASATARRPAPRRT